MTLLVQRDGRLYFSAGSLARLAISGHDIDDPLDIALSDIKVLARHADMLVINNKQYPHCGGAYNDIRLAAKACGVTPRVRDDI
jgi:hypothetical protein